MPPKSPIKARPIRFPKYPTKRPPIDNSKRKAEERSAKNVMTFFGVISALVFLVSSWIWLVRPALPPPPPPVAVVARPPHPPAPPPLPPQDPVPAPALPEPPLPATAAAITFADIRPLFQKYCFACHGATGGKGGLSLTTLVSAMAGGRSRLPGIVPGNAAGSEIIHRISLAPGDRQIMPQRGRATPTPEETQMITDWVNAGAPDGPA